MLGRRERARQSAVDRQRSTVGQSARSVCARTLLTLLAVGSTAGAAEILLKNGLVLDGKSPIPIQALTANLNRSTSPTRSFPILMIDTGIQRYFVADRNVEEVNRDADLRKWEQFDIPLLRKGGRRMVQSLGRVTSTEFDEFGRRRVTFRTSRGEKHVVQGITRLTPKCLSVQSQGYEWELGIPVTSMEVAKLDSILRSAVDLENPDDRMAIARFYLQCQMYPQSDRTLDGIQKDFPELEARVMEFRLELRQLQAKQILQELARRESTGQHQLAYSSAKQFPVDDVDVAALRQVREIIRNYDDRRQQIDGVRQQLSTLEDSLDETQVEAVAQLRTAVDEQLNLNSLERLQPFVRSLVDKSLGADEKLALAYSGWVLGASQAVTDLQQAVRLWQARTLILDYLSADQARLRARTADELKSVEGVGIETVAALIQHLPPTRPGVDAEPGQVAEVEVDSADEDIEVKYSVVLPPEYSADRSYPMIVALRAQGRTAAKELGWWAGSPEQPLQAQRHGYIVIAPEYMPQEAREYDYGAEAHYIVLQSIRDARHRFRVDSDRVFLSGHAMGGDAAFDIGLAHPDVFAGVIPIAGMSDRYCRNYRVNAKTMAWFVVGGQLDRDQLSRNAPDLNFMLRNGYNVVYSEYIGRGYESFYAEIHRLFDWMSLHERRKYPKDINNRTMRPSDNRFFWIRGDGFPKRVAKGLKAMSMTAHVTPGGNTIYLSTGADKSTIWLSPEIIDFNERLIVKLRGSRKMNDFVDADIGAMLEDFRLRGDREKLYWAKLVFD